MKATTAVAKNTRRGREREREREKERKREKKKSSFFSRGGGEVANRSSSLRASKREFRENIHFCNNNNIEKG